MKNINRRKFIKQSSAATAGAMVHLHLIHNLKAQTTGNDTINVAVIGIRSRGKDHYRALAQIPNVKIAVLCDIDQRLFDEAVAEVEQLTGYKPATESEYRKVLENKDIDAVSIATPNHWHALQTIWACQAGKHVYVEKPVSHTVLEGRKMVEAARKYNRVVQTGTQSRSNPATHQAMKFIHESQLGEVYMAKGLCLKPRGNIGHTLDGDIPQGVNWNEFLGPAPYRPFNENRFHYKWHWFWDTGNGDFGNQGIHQADIARWALSQRSHPIRIQGMGKYVVWDSDQETPNIQHVEFEYQDGSVLQFEVRGLPTDPEGGIRIGNIIYGSDGWMSMGNEEGGENQVHFAKVAIQPSGYSSYKEDPGPVFKNEDPATSDTVVMHFKNFIDCVRTGKWQDLNADIMEGHLSTSLCHLGNIASRLGRTLHFDSGAEKFIGDEQANAYLTKMYRAPYLLPDTV